MEKGLTGILISSLSAALYMSGTVKQNGDIPLEFSGVTITPHYVSGEIPTN
jgi:hypothetical protein